MISETLNKRFYNANLDDLYIAKQKLKISKEYLNSYVENNWHGIGKKKENQFKEKQQ